MIGYHSSRSLCEPLSNHHESIKSPVVLNKHYSVSLLDTIPKVASSYSVSLSSSFSSNSQSTQSSSISSSRSSILGDSFSMENNESIKNLNEILNELKTESVNQIHNTSKFLSRKKARKFPKKKSRNVSKELGLFVCRRNVDNLESFKFYFLNKSSQSEECHSKDYDSYLRAIESGNENDLKEIKLEKECDTKIDLQFNFYLDRFLYSRLVLPNSQKKYLSDCYFDTFKRHTKNNKHVKLKTLLKTNDFKSYLTDNSKKLFTLDLKKHDTKRSKNQAICIKYHLYKKSTFLHDSYLRQMDRARYYYRVSQIDNKRQLTQEFIVDNKKVNRSLRYVDINRENDRAQNRGADPPVVINFSIDHNRRNEELNQTYDDLYLEFLISLQHREITPEDYEYLARLDELVKKKTVQDNILDKLKTRTIDAELLEELQRDQEVCGICLDAYALDQVIRYLPCGHKFHVDCIDNWLKNQSTDCPLDKIPVDGSNPSKPQIFSMQMSINEDDSEFEIYNLMEYLLDEVVEDVKITNEVKCLIDDLVNTIDS